MLGAHGTRNRKASHVIAPGTKVIVRGAPATVVRNLGGGDVQVRYENGAHQAVAERDFHRVDGPAAPRPGMVAKGASSTDDPVEDEAPPASPPSEAEAGEAPPGATDDSDVDDQEEDDSELDDESEEDDDGPDEDEG